MKKVLASIVVAVSMSATAAAQGFVAELLTPPVDCQLDITDINNNGEFVAVCVDPVPPAEAADAYVYSNGEFTGLELGIKPSSANIVSELFGKGRRFLRIDDSRIVRVLGLNLTDFRFQYLEIDLNTNERTLTDVRDNEGNVVISTGTEATAFYGLNQTGTYVIGPSLGASGEFFLVQGTEFTQLQSKQNRLLVELLSDNTLYMTNGPSFLPAPAGWACGTSRCTKLPVERFRGLVESANSHGVLVGNLNRLRIKADDAAVWKRKNNGRYARRYLPLAGRDRRKRVSGTFRSRATDVNENGDIVGFTVFKSLTFWSPRGKRGYRAKNLKKVVRSVQSNKRLFIGNAIINDCREIVLTQLNNSRTEFSYVLLSPSEPICSR